MNQSEGIIFDIYRGTTHDGPGMRTTAFLKGCPLACRWCHNPEGISSAQQIWWEERDCIGCGECSSHCKNGLLTLNEQGIKRSENCAVCGECVKSCPTGALSFTGKTVTSKELFKELFKYSIFYEKYGGGITLSGGEPLLQADFVKEVLALAKEKGIHTAVDTCGFVPFESFEKVLPFTDCILYDIKLFNPVLHKEYTGKDNTLILNNFKKIAEYIRENGSPELWVRTPIIPSATDSEENISDIACFIKENSFDVITRWELCAFNNSCANKYKKLNINWNYSEKSFITVKQKEAIRELILKNGISEEKIVISGIIADL